MSEKARKLTYIALALVCVGLVIGMWYDGTFDTKLYDVGLNRNPCYKTSGFVTCGDRAEDYFERQKQNKKDTQKTHEDVEKMAEEFLRQQEREQK